MPPKRVTTSQPTDDGHEGSGIVLVPVRVGDLGRVYQLMAELYEMSAPGPKFVRNDAGERVPSLHSKRPNIARPIETDEGIDIIDDASAGPETSSTKWMRCCGAFISCFYLAGARLSSQPSVVKAVEAAADARTTGTEGNSASSLTVDGRTSPVAASHKWVPLGTMLQLLSASKHRSNAGRS